MSEPLFRTLHALRIKGFAKAESVAELAGLDVEIVCAHLGQLLQSGDAKFREPRSLWQLTAQGRLAHDVALTDDLEGSDKQVLADTYQPFLSLNERFKELCGDWQLRAGVANDHADAGYDAAVVRRLVDLNADAQDVLVALSDVVPRFSGYAPRLAQTCQRVVDGETTMLTGVMCGSYHDVWMELHEDLILTQKIDRVREGSF
ncbi:MAG: MarR family transcriptional regulator [Ilumatobacteraceae bacterium]